MGFLSGFSKVGFVENYGLKECKLHYLLKHWLCLQNVFVPVNIILTLALGNNSKTLMIAILFAECNFFTVTEGSYNNSRTRISGRYMFLVTVRHYAR